MQNTECSSQYKYRSYISALFSFFFTRNIDQPKFSFKIQNNPWNFGKGNCPVGLALNAGLQKVQAYLKPEHLVLTACATSMLHNENGWVDYHMSLHHNQLSRQASLGWELCTRLCHRPTYSHQTSLSAKDFLDFAIKTGYMSFMLAKRFVVLQYFPASFKVLEQLWKW